MVRITVVELAVVLNLGDYSRRCEKQFCSINEIVKVRYIPRNDSVAEFQNIFIVLAQRVRQLFELAA